MALFSYIALDKKGKEIKGTMEADTTQVVINNLRNEGHTPISVNTTSALNKEINIEIFKRKPTARNLAVFCRQFVSIISAGVPVTSAFEMLYEQTENKILANAIDECRLSIQAGTSLSEAMAQHRKIFGDLFITMVAAGEESGSLDTAFARMAQQFEKEEKLKNMVRKATIYPIIVAIVAVIVVLVLLTYVVPQFEVMLSQMDMELPLLTRIVMAASEFVQNSWPVLAAIVVLMTVSTRYYSRTPGGKRFFGKLELKLPLLGVLAVKSASARMSRTMSTLLAAGIHITEALDIVSKTMSNVYFRETLQVVKDEVSLGSPMSEPLSRSDLFPPMVRHMAKIGEEVGDIEGMLDKVADYYDEEVEAATNALTAALEPMIIIVLALVVGVVVMAIMLPLSNMYTGLGNL